MKKTMLILMLSLLACTASQAQLLYKIGGNGLAKPSYVLGTYHLAPASFADSIPGLAAALDNAMQVYGELDMKDALKPGNAAKMQAAQILPEGTTLSSLLDKEQRERLNALLRDVMGVDLDNEAAAAQLDRLTPAALSSTLTLLAYMKENTSFNINALIDTYLQNEAREKGKAVGGFESADFQMEVLYGAPLEKQVDDLMCLVDNFKDVVEMTDFIAAAYFSQDLGLLQELVEEEKESACAGSDEDAETLIYSRNADWVETMPGIMAGKPTLFVVGAAHLVGDRGVLELLRKAGYEVEGMK